MPLVRIDLDDAIRAHGRMDDRATKAAIADALMAAGVRRDDIFVRVIGNTAEDWYAGVDSAAQP
jgi:alpha-D-ribose 1-methylphosphonate 5-triphosphate synthase subunit PhnG